MDEQIKTGPKDVFAHLLTIIGLYVVVISFGAIIFDFINIYLPDPLSRFYGDMRSSLRWPLSVLVVVFPLYVWFSYRVEKDVLAHPEKRQLKTRRWLLYFTLFITTLVIAGDLIAVIFRFLNGELTAQFLLKVATILVIAVAVFIYYTWNLKKDIPASHHPTMKFFVWGIVAIILITIVVGFVVAGSPQSQRLRRFDELRVNDLQSLQSQIVSFWQAKEKLPGNLDELRNDLIGFVPPQDPETGESYSYSITGELTFELCATFNTASMEDDIALRSVAYPFDSGFENTTWEHSEGRVCFSRTIDPSFFPPRKTIDQ